MTYMSMNIYNIFLLPLTLSKLRHISTVLLWGCSTFKITLFFYANVHNASGCQKNTVQHEYFTDNLIFLGFTTIACNLFGKFSPITSSLVQERSACRMKMAKIQIAHPKACMSSLAPFVRCPITSVIFTAIPVPLTCALALSRTLAHSSEKQAKSGRMFGLAANSCTMFEPRSPGVLSSGA